MTNGKRIIPIILAAMVWFPSLAAEDGIRVPGRLSTTQSAGPRSDPIPVIPLRGPIILDGASTEPAWADVSPISLIQHAPHFGQPPSERSEVLLGFDEEYLYVAGRLYDSDPDKIQACTKKRDTMSPSNDWFGVIFDTFNDKENGLGFFTTPCGLRFDLSIYNDAQPASPETGMPSMNLSWNTFWDVKSIQHQEGWFVEMRIPLSSLRFQDRDGKVVMGLISWRFIPRKNELHVFPAIPPDWGAWSSWKPSQAQEIVLEGVRAQRPLYITPYGLNGYGRNFVLNAEETAYVQEDDPVAELGLDIKYGLTNNLTLDLTLNTDFAQVEADDQQVNLTRFSLFFPEKRLFFQERASIFDFNFGGPNRLFYSRRIGIYEDEDEVVPIYGGARLVGRVGPWDLGFMDMQTAPLKAFDLSSENFGVFRVRRRVFNSNSYVGGMLTSRIGTAGTYNVAYGLDGILRVFGQDYLTMNWAQTFQDHAVNRFWSLDPAKIRISWERRTVNGLGYDLSYSRAGETYDPGMGFEMREDFTRFGNRLLYGWIPGERSMLYRHQLFLGGSVTLRNSDRSTESAELGPGWEMESKSGFGGMVQPKFYYESLTEPFEVTDEIEVPVGDYSFFGVEGLFTTPMGRMFSLMSMWEAGSFYDGWRISWGFMPRWNLNSTWELEGFYQYNRVDFPERKQGLTAHLVRLRILATLSTQITLSSFLQYNGISDAVIANFRFRYNPREGNDFFLVYNEVLNTDRAREIPHLPITDNRAVMIKYSYTFNIK